MEQTTSQNIDTSNEAWIADREEAANCAPFDADSLVDRVVQRWKAASIGYKAMAHAQLNREKSRSLATSLREAERALLAVVSAAVPLYTQGFAIGRMPELMAALLRCRSLIVLPVAKRMAERDESGRSANDIALMLARRAQFIDGRAVIDQSLASELPSPYAIETLGD